MLCEDLAHATEQLNMLTEASKKHSGLLQSAQEELTRKEALIQELQHQVRTGGGAGQGGAGEGGCVGSCTVSSEGLGCLPAHLEPLTRQQVSITVVGLWLIFILSLAAVVLYFVFFLR